MSATILRFPRRRSFVSRVRDILAGAITRSWRAQRPRRPLPTWLLKAMVAASVGVLDGLLLYVGVLNWPWALLYVVGYACWLTVLLNGARP